MRPASAQPTPPQGTPAQQAVPPQTPARENPAQIAEEEPDTERQRKHPYVRDLAVGSEGRDVRRLQVWLGELGYLKYYDIIGHQSDGEFGDNTYEKLKEFQRAAGLPVTGAADEKTWNTLQDKYYDYTDADKDKFNDTEVAVIIGNPMYFMGNCTSEFGKRKPPRKGGSTDHRGIDLGRDWGSPNPDLTIYANVKGDVVFAHQGYDGRGRVVVIQSSLDTNIYTISQHLKKEDLTNMDLKSDDQRRITGTLVKVGNQVEPGTPIGTMGGSGSGNEYAYDAHLHYEIVFGDPRTSNGKLKDTDGLARNSWIFLP
jgi:murein DD-endopeptidase MepM/ murein hydrolase activator NlpD